LQTLAASLANKVGENKSLLDTNVNLQAEIKLNNDKREIMRVDLQKQVDTAIADLTTERKNHADQIATMMKTADDLKANSDKTQPDARTAIAVANTQRDNATQRNNQIMSINQGLTKLVALMDAPIPTYSDAFILSTSADGKNVRLNLGSNHGLRPRMTFSVYPADVKEISTNSSKGNIEITKIIDGNTAQASVTNEILMNPMLPGDIIYTPVWRPGQRIHVALSSGLDLDGDKISDPHKVIMLIKMGGGEVDAYIDDLTGEMIDENGKRVRETFLVGEIGDETRFLVVGDKPDPDSSETLFNARRELEDKAKEYGLQTISLNDLQALMGVRPQSQRVGFGPRNRATNDYIMAPDVINQRMPGKVFDKYEHPEDFGKPGIDPPFTNKKTPMSPLFNQNPVTRPTGTVSPLFQPKSPAMPTVESK